MPIKQGVSLTPAQKHCTVCEPVPVCITESEEVTKKSHKRVSIGSDLKPRYGKASVTPHNGKWRIRCPKFTSTKNNVKNGLAETYGYTTEEAANDDALLYEFALLKDAGAHWISFPQRNGDDYFAFYREEYEVSLSPLAKRSSSSLNFNAAQESQFRKFRKIGLEKGEPRLTKIEYHDIFDPKQWSPAEIASKVAHHSQRSVSIKDSDWSPSNLRSRCKVLEKRLVDLQVTYDLLKKHHLNDTGFKLLIRDDNDEAVPRKNCQYDDFSGPQQSRANRQCTTMLMIQVQLMNKATEELELCASHLMNMTQGHDASVMKQMIEDKKV